MSGGALSERELVVRFLRAEAEEARHAQFLAAPGTDKLYRMGQKDGLLLAAAAIDCGQHYPITTKIAARALEQGK